MILHSLLIFQALFTQGAKATSFYIRPFSEFTQTTPNIVHGKLSNIHTENSITSDGARTIYTYAHLEVKEVLKGDLHQKQSITVRKIGGTKDGVTLEIPSSPEFKSDDDTVVFLSPEKEDQSYEVLGLELGKFGLEEKNGNSFLTGGIFNYSKSGPEGSESDHSVRAKELAENQHPWSLNQLRALIRTQNEAANPNSDIRTTLPANQKAFPSPFFPSQTPSPVKITIEPLSTAVKMAESSASFNLGKIALALGALSLALSVFLFLRRK